LLGSHRALWAKCRHSGFDEACQKPDNSCVVSAHGSSPPSRAVPQYRLYGELGSQAWAGHFHFERIPERSSAYQWEIRPHTHEAFLQLLLLERGACTLTLAGAQQRLQAPCLVVTPAQTVHGFQFTPEADGPVVTAAQGALEHLASLLMPELGALLRRPAVLALSDGAPSQTLRALFAALELEWRQHASGQSAAGLSLLTAIAVQVARLQALHPLEPALDHTPQPCATATLGAWASRKAARVQRFRALVDAHFAQHLPLAHYAQALGVSVGQLSRLCRELLGQSARAVIQARLLHEAQRELIYTSANVQQIAQRLGFADEAYFGRFFREHTGHSPRAFRAQARAAMVEGL
jgi:AraC family transcriptional regulator, transcriptional activator of pobA